MPFVKGQSGNENGRPKGSANKNTSKVRDAYTELLEDNLQQLKEDFKDLDPKDRIKLFLEMTKYIIPQLKASELKLDDDTIDRFNMPISKFFGIETE